MPKLMWHGCKLAFQLLPPPADHGMRIRRRLLDERGKPLVANRKVRSGDLVQIELSIRGRRRLSTSRSMTCCLGGWKSRIPGFLTTASDVAEQPQDRGIVNPIFDTRIEMRDDRLVLIGNMSQEGVGTYVYTARAVTPSASSSCPRLMPNACTTWRPTVSHRAACLRCCRWGRRGLLIMCRIRWCHMQWVLRILGRTSGDGRLAHDIISRMTKADRGGVARLPRKDQSGSFAARIVGRIARVLTVCIFLAVFAFVSFLRCCAVVVAIGRASTEQRRRPLSKTETECHSRRLPLMTANGGFLWPRKKSARISSGQSSPLRTIDFTSITVSIGNPWRRQRGRIFGHLGMRRGASTITMQVERLCDPHPRTLLYKISQAIAAEQLEQRETKRQILVEYVNRAPRSAEIWSGAGAASWRYFRTTVRSLVLGQGGALARRIRRSLPTGFAPIVSPEPGGNASQSCAGSHARLRVYHAKAT